MKDRQRIIVGSDFTTVEGTPNEIGEYLDVVCPDFVGFPSDTPEGRQSIMKIMARIDAHKQINLSEIKKNCNDDEWQAWLKKEKNHQRFLKS